MLVLNRVCTWLCLFLHRQHCPHLRSYCQPSERNLGNKVFGGWLMRKGFELAFMTAFLFAQEVRPP